MEQSPIERSKPNGDGSDLQPKATDAKQESIVSGHRSLKTEKQKLNNHQGVSDACLLQSLLITSDLESEEHFIFSQIHQKKLLACVSSKLWLIC
nr:hypothetical protein [Tanacetum cinerariifolium]